MWVPFAVIFGLLVGWCLAATERRNKGARCKVRPVVRKLMADKSDYSGMTVNERLFTAGTLGVFDDAIRRRDRDAAIAILVAIEVEAPDHTVDAVLADPRRYGHA